MPCWIRNHPSGPRFETGSDASFYHPGVLATLAPYNAAFGRHFDDCFHAAASEIKEFAPPCKNRRKHSGQRGGCDVTVEHVAALEEKDLLKVDYSTALEEVSPCIQA